MNIKSIEADINAGWSMLMAVTRAHPKTMTAIYVVFGGVLDHFLITPALHLWGIV